MIEVLGPLQVRGAHPSTGTHVDIGSPRHREVLAALAVDVGRVVSTDALLDRVWGGAGRGASTSNLHAIISRLRSRVAEGGVGVTITTVSPGYRLDAPDAIDSVRFHDLVARARTAHDEGDLRMARHHLDVALGLWRGPAYADIRLPFAEVEAARLEGQRVAACELSVEIDLGLGRTAAALERLTDLVADHPLREGLRRQQMLALYRSGRQVEALEVYRDLRETLADELGIDPGPEVQELHARILAQDAGLRTAPVPAPLRGAPAPQPAGLAAPYWHSEVVVPADDLIGRSRDVDQLSDLITSAGQRLVTVTGVGGVGKTRVAHAVAEAVRGAFADGTAVVSLAAVTDVALVLPAIGRAFGMSTADVLDPLESVASHLRARQVLVVVDNLEHLLDAAADLARLVATCPRISMLVTSRTMLRVRGELQYQLAPLDLPGEQPDPGETASSSAVALFVERARRVAPDFTLEPGNAAAVATICRRLAGIPLALELAAARAHVMPVAAIAEHLDRVMARSGARDLPARQRTMRTTIEWSDRLLEPEQRSLLRRLAVFVGGFTLESVEAVAPGQTDTLELIEELVAHSLVVSDRDEQGLARFRLLEPVAQFAAEELTADDERATRDAHLAYFLALAEAVEPDFHGFGAVAALDVVSREHGNLVAAIEWALASGQAELGGRMAWAMWTFWWLRGHTLEGRRLSLALLASEITDHTRVRVHAVLGAMAFAQGDTQMARHWCMGVVLAASIGDQLGEAHNIAGEGQIALAEGVLDEAEVRFEKTIRLSEEYGLTGEWLWTLSHVWLATVRLLQGRPDLAAPLVTAALAAARRRGDPLAIGVSLFTSAQVALAGDDVDTARMFLDEAAVRSLDTGDLANLAYVFDALVVVESRVGAYERVATVHGASTRLREVVRSAVYTYYRPDEQQLADAHRRARVRLGDAWEPAVARGRSLDPSAAVAYATNPSRQPAG